MADTAKWYVVHTYSGYENTVKATIEKTVESRGLHEQILAVSIPLETVTEISESGVSKTYDRKVYPGYVLVKMVYSDDTWHVIRNVRGVTGFVGTSSNDPTPLTEEEVYEMGVEKREIVVNYAVGDTVRILDGPLSSFTGTVESIEVEKNAVSVNGDDDRDLVTFHCLGTSVEFLDKCGDVNTVLAQCGTHRGGSGSLSGVDLKFDNTSDFLCHDKHLLNKMW